MEQSHINRPRFVFQIVYFSCINTYKSNIIRLDTNIITTFKGGRRFSRPVRTPKTTNYILTHPTTNPLPTQRSFSASDQINALLANDPSISLYLCLFGSKLYWDSLSQESLITTASVDSFLHSFNVIEHFNNIKSRLPSSRYRSIDSSTLQFQRIFLEAKGLQTSIRQYGEILPLSSPSIYVSTNKDDLPIVIDTGASCTITPTLSDFTSKPTQPDTATLGSLSTRSLELHHTMFLKQLFDSFPLNPISNPILPAASLSTLMALPFICPVEQILNFLFN
jgi:hypothetical protein